MNFEDKSTVKPPIDPQFQEFVDKLLQTLKEKDQEILTFKAENESLTCLLSFYREQFDVENFSRTQDTIQSIFL